MQIALNGEFFPFCVITNDRGQYVFMTTVEGLFHGAGEDDEEGGPR